MSYAVSGITIVFMDVPLSQFYTQEMCVVIMAMPDLVLIVLLAVAAGCVCVSMFVWAVMCFCFSFRKF